jgi:type II secretory ATPase GspE/PulE/Tfp pilus assembly ATPase PilB-like protein
MSALLEPTTNAGGPGGGDVAIRLAFSKRLQTVTNRIHSTNNVDEIILEVSRDICQLFEADRMTIYTTSEDGQSIVSRVKTGLNSFKDIKLPISESSLAGFSALHRRHMNIKDVYDDAELKQYSPNLAFLKAVDQRTGYRSRQMLIAPILGGDSGTELMGVIQLINSLSGQPFSSLHDEGVIELAKTLAIAFRVRQQMPGQIASKFEYLVVDGVIQSGELDLATKAARRKNRSVEDILIDEFQVKIPAIGAALAKFFGVEYEAHKSDRIKPLDLLKNLKREYCEQNQWVPLEDSKQGILVAAIDPERVRNSRMVENVFPRAKIVYKVTTGRDFGQMLNLYFGAASEAAMGMGTESIGDLLSGLDEDEDAGMAAADDISAAADNELVKLVNRIIVDAYNQGASDIHVEPLPGKAKTGVRFRKDGSLSNYIEVPASYRNALVTRLKIMCDLDISEKRKPQDGKIKFKKFGPLDIELRVATIPTAGGVEDVVMRILAAGEPLPLDKLGILPTNMERLKSCVTKPYGLFFVCGPTGSGKTTTLHSVLATLNTVETKIWTAEDPVEITQKGLRQCQVNPKAGFTFATAMRAFLRADPDIIMVGEMRDKETTAIGIEASLTGHLVFATLHTNSAPESIIRLLDMGMDPFNFADALLGVLAQRLTKRLCKCKQPYKPTPDEVRHFVTEYCDELKNIPEFKADLNAGYKKVFDRLQKDYGLGKPDYVMYKPAGCDACGNTGYKGRVGLHEMLVGTDPMKKLIQEHARVAEMLATALAEGMLTLKMDGMEKVLQGITDMAQVRAVCIK